MFEILQIIVLCQEPHAKITDEVLKRLIRREFGSRADEVNLKLQQVNSDTPGGKNRLSAAILKLANGNLNRIDVYISVCNNDFRDVVAPAEYPRYSRVGFNKIAKWRKRLIYFADWRAYSNWLRK